MHLTACGLLHVLLLGAATLALSAQAQLIAVPQVESGWLVRAEPTMTQLRESPRARAVLVSIPGGEGRIGLSAVHPARPPRTSYGAMLVWLSDTTRSAGLFHTVAVDSPYVLPADRQLALRAARDHLVRIESVVQHYRDRFGLPVWIMGHSNGGFSVAEFHRHLQSRNREDLIAGLVFSAGRDIARFGSPANLPALFMIAERDGCHATTPAGNQRLYEQFKAGNKAATAFAWIKGGVAEGDPCFNGIHMYAGADEEAASVVEAFVLRQLGPPR